MGCFSIMFGAFAVGAFKKINMCMDYFDLKDLKATSHAGEVITFEQQDLDLVPSTSLRFKDWRALAFSQDEICKPAFGCSKYQNGPSYCSSITIFFSKGGN